LSRQYERSSEDSIPYFGNNYGNIDQLHEDRLDINWNINEFMAVPRILNEKEQHLFDYSDYTFSFLEKEQVKDQNSEKYFDLGDIRNRRYSHNEDNFWSISLINTNKISNKHSLLKQDHKENLSISKPLNNYYQEVKEDKFDDNSVYSQSNWSLLKNKKLIPTVWKTEKATNGSNNEEKLCDSIKSDIQNPRSPVNLNTQF